MFSTFQLPPDSTIRRSMPRPPEGRQGDYVEKFDALTVFYDIFRAGPDVVCLGPPLRNLRDAVLACPEIAALMGNPATGILRERDRGCELWLRTPASRLHLACLGMDVTLPVQDNGSARFAGQRVLTANVRDDDPVWIADWIKFHAAVHGATGALIYDNESSLYSTDDLARRLRAALPEIIIEVLPWPFKFGPGGGFSQTWDWDSDYSDLAILQHARFRWLSQARSVLNLDVDELVVCEEGGSIFDLAEASPSGSVHFRGTWIASARAAAAPGPRRHGQYWYRDTSLGGCPNKWCAVPARIDVSAQWGVHDIHGRPGGLEPPREGVCYRHFKAINNEWKHKRVVETQPIGPQFTPDAALCTALQRAGLIER